MTRFWPVFPALVSVALLAVEPIVAARPRYGGTLRVQTAGSLRTIEPTSSRPPEAGAGGRVLPLAFETLVGVGQDGGIEPRLATAWGVEPPGGRWRVRLRPGVRLHDGSPLTAALVVDRLRANHPDWQITESAGELLIAAGRAIDVPWALADERQAIAVRAATGEWLGTGPFRIDRLTAGRLVLRAHDDYWAGRPFLDVIQVDFARPTAAQLADLEAGRADVVEVLATDERRLVQRDLQVVASRPLETLALVFEAHRAATTTDAVRRTFAAAIDRRAIARVLLQDRAEPGESLLPRWLSGYDGSLLTRPARPLTRSAVGAMPVDQRSWTLRVPASEALARAIGERVAVDAGQAGFTITVQAPAGLAPRADLRLTRLPLQPSSPDRVLAGVMEALTPRTLTYVSRTRAPLAGAPLEDVLRVERALVERDLIVPVVHVSEVYGLGAKVDSWNGAAVLPTGAWNFANIWLTGDAP
jgi:hypothetical protein